MVKRSVVTLGLQGMGLASRHQEDRGERDRLQRGLVGPIQREERPRNLLGVQRGRPRRGPGDTKDVEPVTSGPHPSPEDKSGDSGDHAGSGPWAFAAGPDLELTPFCQVGQGLGGTDTAAFPQVGGCQQRWLRRGFTKPHTGELRCPPADQGKASGSSVGLHPRSQDPSSLPHAPHHAALFAPPPGPLCKQGAPPHASGVQLGSCHLAGPVSLC